MRIRGAVTLYLAAMAAAAPAASTVALQSSATPSFLSTSVTLTAVVTPAGATGAVTFFDGVVPIGAGTLADGKASLSTSALAAGVHALSVYYRGDSSNPPGTSAVLVQTVLSLGQNGFQATTTLGGVINPREAATGDLNGDGKIDLIVANFGSNTISVMLGKGDGTFLPPVNYQTDPAQFPAPTGMVVADFNGDGNMDVAVVNGSTLVNTVAVLLGNGDGTLRKETSYLVQGNPHSLVVADFNGDGIPDLATDNFLFSSIAVLLGKGDGTFQTAMNIPTPSSPINLAVGDFNGDGRADLAVVNQSQASMVTILLGKGDGTFQSPVSYAVGKTAAKIAAADLNGDGRADLVVANIGDNNVSVLLSKGDGAFQLAVNYPAGGGPTTVVIRDFNGDGMPDIAVTDAGENNVSVLLGNGDGTFKALTSYPVGSDPLALVGADFNGDGRTDLAVGNYLAATLSVLLGVPVSEPIISAVQNGATFQNGFVPNAWMTIKGANLSSVTDTWDKFVVNNVLPQVVDGVSVKVGGKPAYVYYISPSQINVVAPDVGAGPATITVTNSTGTSAAFPSTGSVYGPAFFPWFDSDGTVHAVATRTDFSLAVKDGTFSIATVPAKPGELIILWGTAFGPTNPPTPVGVAAPASAPTADPVTVTVGAAVADVFSGHAVLAQGYAAVYQLAITVPNLADGDYPVVATIRGVSSPVTTFLTIKH